MKAWYPYSVLSFCAKLGNYKIRKKRVVVQESIVNHQMERLLIPQLPIVVQVPLYIRTIINQNNGSYDLVLFRGIALYVVR